MKIALVHTHYDEAHLAAVIGAAVAGIYSVLSN